MSGLRKYVSFARTSLEITFVYRAGFVLNMIGTIFYVVAMFYLWQTIFLGNPGSLGGFTWPEMKAYLLVSFLLSSLLTWYDEWIMSQDMREGRVAIDLARPIDFQATRLATAIGPIGFEAISAIAVALIVAFVFGGAALPSTRALRAVRRFVRPGDAHQVRPRLLRLDDRVLDHEHRRHHGRPPRHPEHLLGRPDPARLLPGLAPSVAARVLPFPAMISTPALVYLGKLDAPSTAVAIGVQIVWAVGLLILGRLAFRQAVKVVTIHGG